MNSKNKYEFGDFSFFENTREYYDYVIFLSIIEKYNLWDFVEKFSSLDKNSDEYRNKLMIFDDYYNNIGYDLYESTYYEIMVNFEEIKTFGWETFVIENVDYDWNKFIW